LRTFPEAVRADFGFALYAAQQGTTDPSAKPLKGFLGTAVMEIVDRHDGDTYRAVYTARWKNRLYVLHCFKKKSNQGIKTPRPDIEVIRSRLAEAERLEAGRVKKQASEKSAKGRKD
jgi:phage-related protein